MVGFLFVFGLLTATTAQAQSGGPFDLSRSVIAGGGGASAASSIEADGTIGQSAAGQLSGGSFELKGGFWTALSAPEPVATATSTSTPMSTPTSSPSPTPTHTLPVTLTPTATMVVTGSSTPVASATPTATPSLSPTLAPSSTATPTATATPAFCVGDCNEDDLVTVDEIIRMVSIALGVDELTRCPAADADGNTEVSVDEIIAAVNNALDGCNAAGAAG
jgi:hypothetical protein